MNLNKLNEIMDFKWRVQSFSKFKAQGQCVAYIDARDAQKKLDEICGKENWQALYYEVGSMLFCKVGIKIGEEWVWKSDTGSESNIEKEKGHSSDAFKRACVLWGIGRFLYDMKIQYVDANEKKTTSNFPYVISNGNRVWDLTKHIRDKKPALREDIAESFSDKMKGYATNEGDIYWAIMEANNYKKASDVPLKEQKAILKQLDSEVKKGGK